MKATLDKMLEALTPEIVASFRQAIELGKWPDGRRITPEQRQTCMEAMIAWEHHHLPEEERTGYIHKVEKGEGDSCGLPHDTDEENPIKFIQ